MSAHIVSATLRLSVVAPGRRVDLAVPLWMDVASLARAYAEEVGATEPPLLATRAGRPLAPDLPLEQTGLRHGDVLTVLDPAAAPQADTERQQHSRGRRSPLLVPALLTGSVVCGLAAAVLVAAGSHASWARSGCLVVLLVCALATALRRQRPGSPRDIGASDRAIAASSPLFGAAAGVVAAYTSRPGGVVLTLLVAMLGALVFAAVARAGLDELHDELVDVALAVAATGALLAVATLLLGASVSALLAVVFVAAVVWARLLPYAVVDVPDDVLLDLDQLAVTAWSARDRPRRMRRRRAMIRPEGVAAVVDRGRRLVAAGTVVVAVTVSVAAPLLVLGTRWDVRGIGAMVMVGTGGAALALMARSVRAALPRLAMRLSAAWVLGVLGFELVTHADRSWALGGFVAAAALGSLAALVAVLLGRGWRSLWWGRAADLAEALCVVATVAAVVAASGLFDAVRSFTS